MWRIRLWFVLFWFGWLLDFSWIFYILLSNLCCFFSEVWFDIFMWIIVWLLNWVKCGVKLNCLLFFFLMYVGVRLWIDVSYFKYLLVLVLVVLFFSEYWWFVCRMNLWWFLKWLFKLSGLLGLNLVKEIVNWLWMMLIVYGVVLVECVNLIFSI